MTWGLLKNLLKHFELFHITKAKHKLVMQNELKDKIALLDCLIGLESTLAISILLLHYGILYVTSFLRGDVSYEFFFPSGDMSNLAYNGSKNLNF